MVWTTALHGSFGFGPHLLLLLVLVVRCMPALLIGETTARLGTPSRAPALPFPTAVAWHGITNADGG